MKNEQKYKTPNERVEAFDRWRMTIKCEGCSQMCDTCEAGPLADECAFKWLALEAVGEEKVADCNHLGNAAKIREAVENALDKLLLWNYTDQYTARMALGVVKKLHAAISAPPRNCDRPECATTKAAQDVWRKEDGGKTAYYEWLLATYTKGGTDGRK